MEFRLYLNFLLGVFRFLQMIEFALNVFFLVFSKLPKPDIIILSSMSIFPLACSLIFGEILQL